MMQTSAPGLTDSLPNGFTLVETLVVLLILAIVATAATLGINANKTDGELFKDARQLAMKLSLAHNEARVRNQSFAFRHDDEGYWFDMIVTRPAALPIRTAQPLSTTISSKFQFHPWSSNSTKVFVDPYNATLFSPEWLSGPERIVLDNGTTRIQIERVAPGQYEARH